MSVFVSKHAYRSMAHMEDESNKHGKPSIVYTSRKASEELPTYSQATRESDRTPGKGQRLVSAVKERWHMHDAETQIEARKKDAHASAKYTQGSVIR